MRNSSGGDPAPDYMPRCGVVAASRAARNAIASSRCAPHISSVGLRLAHTAGLSGLPKIAQRKSGSNCTHFSPARLPCGMPGIGDEIEGAMQHAPQPGRQSMRAVFRRRTNFSSGAAACVTRRLHERSRTPVSCPTWIRSPKTAHRHPRAPLRFVNY